MAMIRELKALTDRLSKYEERLALVLDAAEIGVWEWYINKDLVDCDLKMQNIHNINEPYITGLTNFIAKVAHPSDTKLIEGAIKDSLATGNKLACTFKTLSGNDFTTFKIKPVKNAEGVVEKVVGISYIEDEHIGYNRITAPIFNSNKPGYALTMG